MSDPTDCAAPAVGPHGYRDPAYAHSLAQFGTPRELPHAGGWVIERAIAGTDARDAMGPYPLFCCREWSGLPEDLRSLREAGLVSVVLVTDSALAPRDREVFRHFDVARPFKAHFLSTLEVQPDAFVSRHHRYYARKAARTLELDIPATPLDYLDEWLELHACLRSRHGISGLRAFSRAHFAGLLGMPGVVLLRAVLRGKAVGAKIVVVHDGIAHAHLGCCSDEGYRQRASYLLDWETLRHFRGRASHVNWGGEAGDANGGASGLARYKQGWASEQRQSYLLGAILDAARYQALGALQEARPSDYFPRYRSGEFG
jgi:hypothetical protein